MILFYIKTLNICIRWVNIFICKIDVVNVWRNIISQGFAKSKIFGVGSTIIQQIHTSNIDTRNLSKNKNIKEQIYILYQLNNGNDYTKGFHMCVCKI